MPRILTPLPILVTLGLLCAGPTLAQITGTVFLDHDADGLYDTVAATVGNSGGSGTVSGSVDRPAAGVGVEVFDAAGTSCGSTVTDAAGAWSITVGGACVGSDFRVEFELPPGLRPSARSTDSVGGGLPGDAGSTTQFVDSPNAFDVNLAVGSPLEYCQDFPALATSCYTWGDQVSGPNAALTALLSFPYEAGTDRTTGGLPFTDFDNPTSHALEVASEEIGTTWGLAYSRSRGVLFAASFYKRHSGFGPGADGTINTPDDPGAVYRVDVASGNVLGAFTVPAATTNPHNVTDYDRDEPDPNPPHEGWDAAGKFSLGGIAMSEDESTLYVVNLEDRSLYALDPDTGAVLGSRAFPLSGLPTPGGTTATCATADVRPFALAFLRDTLWAGAVCSAQSTGSAADLFAYVFAVDPTTLAFDGSPAFQMALDYPRACATNRLSSPCIEGEWLPWVDVYSTIFATNFPVYPQPWLTDLAFAGEDLILGIRDRMGENQGNGTLPPGTSAVRRNAISTGDMLRACGTLGSWTLESNGRCGGLGTAPQNTGEGPGDGEFYFDDFFVRFHDEILMGGLAVVPGTPDVLSTTMDPINLDVQEAEFDAGITWHDNSTGARRKSYRVYAGVSNNLTFLGKANGLGDLEPLCEPAPVEVGNRVWQDDNQNGVQDPGEPPIPGVTVRLYQGGTLVATAVTDANGEFYFVEGSGPDPSPGDELGVLPDRFTYRVPYEVRLDLPADQSTGPLAGLQLTEQDDAVTSPGGSDRNDSDASEVTDPVGSPSGTFPVIGFTVDGPGDNDHTLDFGFFPPQTVGYDLALRKTVTTPGPVMPGDVVAFEIEIFNQGTLDATDVELVDYVDLGMWEPFETANNPPGTTGGAAALPYAWSVSGTDGRVVVTGTLSSGSSITLPVRLTVADGASGQLENFAEIAVDDGDDADSQPEDEESDRNGDPLVDDEILNAGGDEDDHDIAVIDVGVPPTGIPTLDHAGMLVLLLLVAAVAWRRLS